MKALFILPLSLHRGDIRCMSPYKIYTAMFTVIKRMEISASHKLVLPYRSKCASLHGHNWIITVYCRSSRLNSEGMVVDFTRIKEVVTEKLDHQNLNEVLPFNPTAAVLSCPLPGC